MPRPGVVANDGRRADGQSGGERQIVLFMISRVLWIIGVCKFTRSGVDEVCALAPAGPHGLDGRLDRLIDVVFRVGGRDEGGLELAARQINAACEHFPEETGKEPGVASASIVVVVYRAVMKKQGQHAAGALDDMRHSGVGCGAVEPFGQPSGKGLETLVWRRVMQQSGAWSGRRPWRGGFRKACPPGRWDRPVKPGP